ncbi:MAG: tyrosine-type recombinase/integrase [Lachnospiraceae bacterium]|nr:tyrosine-type recombinase/integrase [Lachnospiraceae bacterium]
MKNCIDYGTLSFKDAQKIYAMKEREEILKGYSFPDHPSKDGYYRVYIKDATKKSGRRQLTGKTLDELKEKVYAFEKGISGKARKTFKDVFLITQEEKLKYVKNPEKVVSVQNTISRNRSEYKRFFEGTFIESRYLDAITKDELEKIVLLNLQRYDLRRKGLASMQSILKAIFSLGYEQYWIKDNIYSRLNFKKFSDMLVESVPVSERVHSNEEIEKMLEYIHEHQKSKPDYIPAWAMEMQILTGTRRGELPPLRWSDIHEEYIEIKRSQITVKKDGSRKEYFQIVSHTKNYKNRNFPITDDLKIFLNRLVKMQDRFYPGAEFLFPADTSNGVITNNVVYGFYRRMCKKLGIIQIPGIIKGTHSFRRNNITAVVNATNGNLVLASSLFGNTPDVAEKNYYTGTNLAVAKNALESRKFLTKN